MSAASLIASGEFDAEVVLRTNGDAFLAAFAGQALASGVPVSQLPPYDTLGTLVDLTNATSLMAGLFAMDTRKNSKQLFLAGAELKISNPRNVFFNDVFRITQTDTQDVLISLSGEVGWAGQETASSITLGETAQSFTDGGFCTGGQVTYMTIGRIAAVFRVLAGVVLHGRRGKLVPSRNSIIGLTFKRQIICTAQQVITALAGETYATAKLWGAGGGTEVIGDDTAKGGVGGFTRQSFTVTVGVSYTLLPGAGGLDLVGAVGGFGGQKGTLGRSGGGGSFIWTGSVTPTAALDTGLLAAAGGGGGGKVVSPGVKFRGGHGNAATGGQSTHAGQNGDTTHSGGGGGWRGGNQGGDTAGLGGSGYLSAPTNGEILLQTGGAADGPTVNPGSGDIDWQQGYGGAGQPGLIVVNIYGP